jgi:hypothetical protein
VKLSSLVLAHLAILVSFFALGCGGAFKRPDISWPKATDGRTIIPYQLVREGSVQNIELRPMNVAPMTPASEAAWREAIGKWNAVTPAVQFVETDSLMPSGNSPGVLIYDVTELPEDVEGTFSWYAPDGPVLRARAYCGAIGPKSDIRFARYFRLHEIGHAMLLPHSTIPTAVMWPWRIGFLGAPSVDLTSTDRRDLRRRYL